MENKNDLIAELAKKLETAKTAEEAAALMSAELKVKELSLDELGEVAGGVPEYFLVSGIKVSPDQIYEWTETVRQTSGMDVAIEFLTGMVRDYYSPNNLRAVANAFKVYGRNMWAYLASQGL